MSIMNAVVRTQAFYDWGLNCQVLGYSADTTSRILDEWGETYASIDYEMFWDGYFNGHRANGQVISISIPK